MASGLFSAGLLTLIGGLSGSYWASFTMRFLAGLLVRIESLMCNRFSIPFFR